MTKKSFGRIGRFNSDLATERRRADTACDGIYFLKERATIGEWERITVKNEEAEAEIGRPIGRYDTLNLPPLGELDCLDIEDAIDEVARELCMLTEINRATPYRILVVGLGNGDLTPDSIGTKCASLISPTLHISKEDPEAFDALRCSEIAVIAPGVKAENGISSADIIGGVAERIVPSLVIAIDSLAARSPKRLGTTLQFCDTGIHPGSGVGSHEKAIDEDLVGTTVIAIGVPTVIDSRLIVEGENDTGTTGMMVTPKDIDEISNVAAKIIAGGINQAFGLMR
ncbi:MAG: GPR endopeptidase [Clostridia bacterium]|nr:GPR endopeptidase [Clostridia bacterium]